MKKLDLRSMVFTRFSGEHNAYLCGGPFQAIVDFINNIKSGASDPDSQAPFIIPQLEPIIRELASYAPQWQYFFPITYTGANKVNEMYIMFEGETIGWVQYDNSYSQDYLYDSRSLSNKRERGFCSRTKKADKLIAVLKKNVRARTVDERLAEIIITGTSAVQTATYKASNKYTSRRDGLFKDISEKLLANWEQVADIAGIPPEGRDIGLELLAGQAEYEESVRIGSAVQAKTAAVLVDGNRFLIKRFADTTYKSMQREEAPEAVRTALGILKLCEVDMYVAGFGMRHTDDTFTIIHEGKL
jgi:hypothetical protein